jgi:hypothetical protein
MHKPQPITSKLKLGNECYHSHPALSSSQLKLALSNIELFKKSVIDKAIPSKASAAMQMGTLFHEMVLEPEVFEPVIYPGKVDRRKKEYKDWAEEHEGDVILSQDQMDTLDQMYVSLHDHIDCPDFSELTNESSLFYNWRNRDLRVRPDAADYKNRIIYDLKTSAKPVGSKDFMRSVEQYDYDLSAAMYLHAISCFTEKPWRFCFVVVQSVEPYTTAMYWVGESLFFQGFAKYKEALTNIELAEATDTYRLQTHAETLQTWRDVVKFDASEYYNPSTL